MYMELLRFKEDSVGNKILSSILCGSSWEEDSLSLWRFQSSIGSEFTNVPEESKSADCALDYTVQYVKNFQAPTERWWVDKKTYCISDGRICGNASKQDSSKRSIFCRVPRNLGSALGWHGHGHGKRHRFRPVSEKWQSTRKYRQGDTSPR